MQYGKSLAGRCWWACLGAGLWLNMQPGGTLRTTRSLTPSQCWIPLGGGLGTVEGWQRAPWWRPGSHVRGRNSFYFPWGGGDTESLAGQVVSTGMVVASLLSGHKAGLAGLSLLLGWPSGGQWQTVPNASTGSICGMYRAVTVVGLLGRWTWFCDNGATPLSTEMRG
jgi:hypothetical protein